MGLFEKPLGALPLALINTPYILITRHKNPALCPR